VVVGESLVDVVLPQHGRMSREPGGSPFNVAVGLARLAVPTVLITRVGADPDGRLDTAHARDSGVRLAAGSVRPDLVTSTSTARLDADHAASYTFELCWDLPSQLLPADAAGLHVGSIASYLPPGHLAVHDLARQADAAGVFVSYDPNIRPAFIDDPEQCWQQVVDLAGRARLVKTSDEDLRPVAELDCIDTLARTLLAGPATELVVVTHGGRGATAYVDGARVEVPGHPVQVVDTVGAGDSFMAALLAVLTDWGCVAAGPGSLRALDQSRLTRLLAAAGRAAPRRRAGGGGKRTTAERGI
jgi:fructokinase